MNIYHRMNKAMREAIEDKLIALEREGGVRILYAAESGSRAWGFSSADSDWDIRGIYVRDLEWYLSIDIERRRDVIEVSEGNLDISLWDLRKALQLGAKSNPALFEWFNSPVIYLNSDEVNLVSIALGPFYSLRRASYHYYHMAKGNFDRYLQGNRVKLKKYLYVLRPVLVLHWLEFQRANPHIEFDVLFRHSCNKGLVPESVRSEIINLVERKRNGDELDESNQNWILYDWLREQLYWAEELPDRLPDSDADFESLNEAFREIVYG